MDPEFWPPASVCPNPKCPQQSHPHLIVLLGSSSLCFGSLQLLGSGTWFCLCFWIWLPVWYVKKTETVHIRVLSHPFLTVSVNCLFFITFQTEELGTWNHFTIFLQPFPALWTSIIFIFRVLYNCHKGTLWLLIDGTRHLCQICSNVGNMCQEIPLRYVFLLVWLIQEDK